MPGIDEVLCINPDHAPQKGARASGRTDDQSVALVVIGACRWPSDTPPPSPLSQ